VGVDIALDPARNPARRDPIAEELAALGLSPAAASLFRDTLAARDGLLLIVGAEGSGRTTTLEAARRLRPDGDALTFDGIDDPENARRALGAASSGRFVVAAMRACDAVGAIVRLRALSADPFQVAAALRAAFAQRLARRLCHRCRKPVQASRDASARLGFDPGMVVHVPVGCAICGGSGYVSRFGLFEAIAVDPPMRPLIERGDAAIIAGQAFRGGPDLAGAARAMVKVGEISAEDAVRLSRRPDQLP
jgi:general secretion pathway protein E